MYIHRPCHWSPEGSLRNLSHARLDSPRALVLSMPYEPPSKPLRSPTSHPSPSGLLFGANRCISLSLTLSLSLSLSPYMHIGHMKSNTHTIYSERYRYHRHQHLLVMSLVAMPTDHLPCPSPHACFRPSRDPGSSPFS